MLGPTDGHVRQNFKKGMQGSTDRRFGPIFFINVCSDPRMVELGQFLKGDTQIHGRANRSKFLKGNAGIHGRSKQVKFLKGDTGINGQLIWSDFSKGLQGLSSV